MSPIEELYKAQKQQICLAILEGKTEQVQKILGKDFVPDGEVLNVAAGADSTKIFKLIADASSFSEGNFASAVEVNIEAWRTEDVKISRSRLPCIKRLSLIVVRR